MISCPEGALVKANAVVQAGSNYLFYCYDQNGNLRRRKVGTTSTTIYSYDAENRLTSVSGAAAATFVYDGDGNRGQGHLRQHDHGLRGQHL
ncbi:MAG: RHS repeat domain-containing protein [Anaerolineae bacterium]